MPSAKILLSALTVIQRPMTENQYFFSVCLLFIYLFTYLLIYLFFPFDIIVNY